MKKNLSSAVCIFIIAFSFLQSNAQTFNVKSGLTISNTLEKDNDTKHSKDFKAKVGFHFGINLDIPIAKNTSFEPGLMYTQKGSKTKDDLDILLEKYEVTYTSNLHYMNIPLVLKHTFPLNENLSIYAAYGGYVGVALGGNVEVSTESEGNSISTKTDISWGSDESDHLQRLDAGLSFGVGLELKSILLGITYDHGQANISSKQNNGYTIKNRSLMFSVGYKFGK